MDSSCLETTSAGDQVVTLKCIPSLIHNLINFGFGLAGTVTLIFLILAGFRLIRAGDTKQAEEARDMITHSIIGLAIILLSVLILQVIGTVTGVHCIQTLDFGSCK